MIAIIAYAVATVAGTYNNTGGGAHRRDERVSNARPPKRKVAGRRKRNR